MAAKITGKTQPRLWTPPLRTLRRETSAGYQLAEFAALIGEPLLPWQRWLAVHMLETNRDGSFRFRIIVVLVSRQNGKTHIARLLALWRLYVTGARLILGTAQDLSMARESQQECIEMIRASPYLAQDLAEVRRANGDELFRVNSDITYDDIDGDESFTLAGSGRYKIAAPSRRAGRGLSVDLLMIDELREWRSIEPWSALSKTTMARAEGLAFCTSNAGDDQSIVLNQLRDAALSGRDDSIGLFEWSGEDGCELDDPRAWAQANPGLGLTVSARALATASVSDPVTTFRTECLCQRVSQLDGAVDHAAWQACHDPAGTMEGLRDRIAACFDAAPDGQHATLCVAARLPDGRARLEVAGAWKSTDTARAELPGLLGRIQPKVIAWYPGGPAGAFTTVLRPASIPYGVTYTELNGTAAAGACMEFSDLVRSRRVVHAGDEILDAQIRSAAKAKSADGWRFTRSGQSHVDGCYAAAGAISAALSMPEPRQARIRLVG